MNGQGGVPFIRWRESGAVHLLDNFHLRTAFFMTISPCEVYHPVDLM
jgi:hypothetical protein